MRNSASVLIGVSLLLGFTWAYNFDDQNRVLQRTRDMKDVTPMTDDEGKRLRSLIDGGRLKVKDPRETGLPKRLEDAKNTVTRRLKEGRGKHEGRAARIPRDASYTIAVDIPPKTEKGTKAAPEGTSRQSSTSYTIAVDDPPKREKGTKAHPEEATRESSSSYTDDPPKREKSTKAHPEEATRESSYSSYTIAVDDPPKREKGTKAHPEEATRESSSSYTIAVDDPPKREKGTKALPDEATRSKPAETGRKKPKKTNRHDSSGVQGGYHENYLTGDDQVYYDDDALVGGGTGSGGGLSYVFMYLEGFQDARNIASGIPPNSARPDEFSAGTVYIFNNEPIYGVTYDQFSGNSTTGITVDESDLFAEVTGQCIRTDPNDQLDTQNYVGRAYCQFVYTSTGLNDDVLTAEGPIQIGEDAILAVTGGRGVYRRTVGEVILTPVDDAALTSTPPSIEFNYDLDLPTSYYMQAYIYMDVSLLPPEVLS